ncbi:MAG: PIG-L family deacetylase [Thermacetogeniaceae bacterium]
MGVSAVVPAYNEALTVGRIIEVLKKVPLVDEIIVVDDGSKDGTAEVAERHGATVIRLPANRGKGAAMTAGARRAKGDVLLFLDADLQGLTPQHVVDLLEPVLKDEADMTVGVFQNGRRFTDYAQLLAPSISGQRAIRKDLFLDAGVGRSRFEVEVILTRFAREKGLRVKKVPLPNMTHLVKEEKRGIVRGAVERMGMYRDILGYFWKAGPRRRAMQPAFKLFVFLFFVLLGYNMFYIKSIRAARAEASRLMHLELGRRKQRILVVSPHPDDETLACGCLIADAVRRGFAVHVVFLTSGDGFRRGLEIYRHKLNPTPDEFLEYGRQRMAEAANALRSLGLGSGDITFLGYPDGGLDELWERYRTAPDEPYLSPWTRQQAVPYAEALSPGADYTANNVLKDIVAVIRSFKPTAVFVPDLEDSHPDHRAAGAFALAAVAAYEEESPGRPVRIYSYLIHAGLWQLVPELDKNVLLLPPRSFLERGTAWYTFPASPDSLQRKKEAISCYRTQKKVIFSFMNNFLRPNEVFSGVRAADVERCRRRQELPQGEERPQHLWRSGGV